MTSSDLEEIQTGDELQLRHDRNRIAATAVRNADTITVAAFNTTILVATRTAAGKRKPAARIGFIHT